ncbi:MAG: hypothetical protein ABI559_13785 [Chloroflexota bacterium]
MTTTKRLYLLTALIAVLAIAAATVTLSSQLTSADSPPATGDAARIDDGRELLPQAKITVDQAIAAAQTATIDPANSDGETADDNTSGDNTAADPNNSDGETADDNTSGGNTAADPSNSDGETADDNTSGDNTVADPGNSDGETGDDGATIGEIDLEQYNGALVFNVDVGGVDVKVDATTGTVVGQGSN